MSRHALSKRDHQESRRKAFFLGVNQLGDFLCTTPAIRAFKKRHPDTFVTYVVPNAPYFRLLDGNPDIDLVLYREDLYVHGGDIVDEQWCRSLPVEIDQPCYLFRLSIEAVHCYPGVFDDHLSRGFARLLSLELDSVRPVVNLLEHERRVARSYFRKPYIVLNMHASSAVVGPGGTFVVKDWLFERWLSLAHRLAERGDYDIVAIGSAAQPQVQSRYFRNLYGLPIKIVAAVLENAACVVTVESGISHLCHAVDAPMVVIYSQDVPVPWGYPSEASNCRVLIDDLRVISCDDVMNAVESILRDKKRSPA